MGTQGSCRPAGTGHPGLLVLWPPSRSQAWGWAPGLRERGPRCRAAGPPPPDPRPPPAKWLPAAPGPGWEASPPWPQQSPDFQSPRWPGHLLSPPPKPPAASPALNPVAPSSLPARAHGRRWPREGAEAGGERRAGDGGRGEAAAEVSRGGRRPCFSRCRALSACSGRGGQGPAALPDPQRPAAAWGPGGPPSAAPRPGTLLSRARPQRRLLLLQPRGSAGLLGTCLSPRMTLESPLATWHGSWPRSPGVAWTPELCRRASG